MAVCVACTVHVIAAVMQAYNPISQDSIYSVGACVTKFRFAYATATLTVRSADADGIERRATRTLARNFDYYAMRVPLT